MLMRRLFFLVAVAGLISGCAAARPPTPSPIVSTLPVPTLTPTSAPTSTALPTATATSTIEPTPTPTTEPTAVVEDLLARFPAAWPVAPFSAEEVAEASACAETLYEEAQERYPSTVSAQELPYVVPIETACDWATLAVAYALREDNEAGQEAYLTAVYLNPAYSLANALLAGYFASYPLVEAPPLTEQALTSATIMYSYSGIGYTGGYTLNITSDDAGAHVTGSGHEEDTLSSEETVVRDYSVDQTLENEVINTLGEALTDLIPVENEMELLSCFDNYPDWEVTLTYADGTRISSRTNGSNVLGGGGPWQVIIEDQRYVQMSPALIEAVAHIHETLELPWGGTAAMNCHGAPSILEAGFSSSE
jgi:hypothetical protein